MEEWRRFLTPRERDNKYEELLAGGAKIRLHESFIDFELASLLAAEGAASQQRPSLRNWHSIPSTPRSGCTCSA